MNRSIIAISAALLSFSSMQAATSLPAPEIIPVADQTYGGALENLSDNGLWAVGWGKSEGTEGEYSFPRLYNLTTKEQTYLFTADEAASITSMTANDVTDDGSIVVGSFDGKPAVWRAATKKWEYVENKHQYKNGVIERITPDGRLAIGTLKLGDGMFATMRVWDLSGETVKDITPDNLPKPIGPNLSDTEGALDEMVQQLYAGSISYDGAYFTGMVNFSYPNDCWTFIYDMKNKSWRGIGMEVTENGDKYTFNRNIDGIFYANPGSFVGNSHNITGELYSPEDESGIFLYDADTNQFTVEPESTGYESAISDPLGTIYASRSYEGPMRDWYFKCGKYWFDFAVVAQQLWNINWTEQIAKDGIGLTGTLTNVSNDGLTLMASDFSASPYVTYIIKLPAPLPEVVKDFNMLGNYYTTPVNNASFAYLREVKVTFDRSIDVLGGYDAVSLIDQNGDVVAKSVQLAKDAGDSRTVSAVFRNRRLEEGKSYTVVFPAGVVSISGDAALLNDEIRVNYKGRPDAPVAPVAISPANGSEVARINANSNPVSIRFNSEISVVETNQNPMVLNLIGEDGTRERIAVLNGSINGDVISVYPVLEQRLAYGSKYEVIIPAGTVADISGADPNEEIVLQYLGAYIPEGPSIDGVLFEDNFDQGMTNKWMYFDGASDLEPSDLMTQWGFSAGLPWWTVRESESSTEQSAASHSMFKNPGESDAWMVTSLLNVADDSAYLSFKSQSYHNSGDELTVYVYTTDDIYTALTSSIVNNMRYYGDEVYREVQTPGASDELLSGDWRENVISLAKYAGKNIYVAFVNKNRNKSAIFLDDVKIAMDVKVALINLTPASVVDKDEINIEGQLRVMSKTDTFTGYTINLLDADGNVVSTLADPDAVASEGWKLDFKMPDALPITVGKENKYQLAVKMGDVSKTLDASVLDLAVQTTKKVVVEEYTGQGCQFCPLGHAATEWILKDLPGLVLPIELHCYPGDNFNNDMVTLLNQNLGMAAAPTARINRGSEIVSPMAMDETGIYVYKNNNLWYDHIVAELQDYAPADVEVTGLSFDGVNCVADIQVTYAIDMENVNHNLLIELCEDEISGRQDNGVAYENQPNLGEWAAGGIYGGSRVKYTYHNVLRNWEGTTYNGTGGLVPASIKAGVPYTVQMKVLAPQSILDIDKTHVTAMLIDSESGKVLNADRRFMNPESAVEVISSDLYTLSVDGRNVVVSYPGAIAVEAYTIAGMKLASASGSDSVSLELNESGIILLNVATPEGIRHHKLLLR